MDNIGDIMHRLPTVREQKTGEIKVMPNRLAPQVPRPERVMDSDACPFCKGDGWLRPDVPLGHPGFGKAVRCQCQAVRSARIALSRTYSWLGASARQVAEMESMTFASFNPRANGESVAVAYKRAKGYADDLRAGPLDAQKNALFVGPLGVGKTHLVGAVINHVRASGISCLFAAGNELFQALFDSFDEDASEHLLRRAIEIDVLCLDDLDKMQMVKDGSYQKSTLFTIFNARYIAHRPIIITANNDDSWQQWVNPAHLSRLLGKGKAEIIAVQGQDYRMMVGG